MITSCVLSWKMHSVEVSAFTATISLVNKGRLFATRLNHYLANKAK